MVLTAGVDLGTTFTAAAINRDGQVEMFRLGSSGFTIPSVLYIDASGAMTTGTTAQRRLATEPDRVAHEFKRRMGDPAPIMIGGTPVAAHILTGRLLDWVVDRIEEQEGARPELVTVTHPANWGPFRRELMDQAIKAAEVARTVTITEPEAAAIAYATTRPVDPGASVAVYDLGGGTFDAAILRRTPTGFDLVGTPDGVEQLGGLDFDATLFGFVTEQLGVDLDTLDPEQPGVHAAVQRLRHDVVDAKIALSTDTEATISVVLPGIEGDVRVTRAEFEQRITPLLQETITALHRTLRSADISPGDLDRVLLVGGSSRIPLVGQLLAAEIGRPVAIDADPKNAIARGAAYHAHAQIEPSTERAAFAPPVTSAAPITPPPAAPPPSPPKPAATASAPPPAAPVPTPPSTPPPVAAPSPPTAPARVSAPIGGPLPSFASGLPGPSAPSPEAKSKLPVIIGGAVAAVLLIVVAFVALSGGGDDSGNERASTDDSVPADEDDGSSSGSSKDGGAGSFSGVVRTESELVEKLVTVSPGDAVGIRVTGSTGFDSLFAIGADQETIDAWADWEELELRDPNAGSNYRSFAKDFEASSGSDPKGDVLVGIDAEEAGGAEQFAFVAVVGGTFRILVGGFETSTGSFDLDIEIERSSQTFEVLNLAQVNDLRLGEHRAVLERFGLEGLVDIEPIDERQDGLDDQQIIANMGSRIEEDLGVTPEEGLCVAQILADEFTVATLLESGMLTDGSINEMSDEDKTLLQDKVVEVLPKCAEG